MPKRKIAVEKLLDIALHSELRDCRLTSSSREDLGNALRVSERPRIS